MQVEVQPKAHIETEATNPQANYSNCFDDDGRLKRTGKFNNLPIFKIKEKHFFFGFWDSYFCHQEVLKDKVKLRIFNYIIQKVENIS